MKQACDLLQDERFKQLFHDPDFEVDQDSEQYKQIAPMLKKLESKKPKRTEEPETSTEVRTSSLHAHLKFLAPTTARLPGRRDQ